MTQPSAPEQRGASKGGKERSTQSPEDGGLLGRRESEKQTVGSRVENRSDHEVSKLVGAGPARRKTQGQQDSQQDVRTAGKEGNKAGLRGEMLEKEEMGS